MAERIRIAGVDDQAVQPGLEAFRLAQPGQVAPRCKKSLFSRVLSPVWVAEDAVCHGVATVDRFRRDLGERVAIPLHRPPDLVDVHMYLGNGKPIHKMHSPATLNVI